MIEVLESALHNANLIIDGVTYTYKEGLYIYENTPRGGFELIIFNDDLSNKLFPRRISDFSEQIKRVGLYGRYNLLQDVQDISQGISIVRREKGEIHAVISFYFSPEHWKHLWSISEYQIEFKQTFERESLPDIFWNSEWLKYFPSPLSPETDISLSFPIEDANTTIKTEFYRHSDILNHLHKLAEESLISKLQKESLLIHFDFPEEVRVPCEQYLLYFAQFLKDLGVEANTALTHEAGQVLFTVTPDDKEQALDKIRSALDVYLHLPSNPIRDAANEAIAIQRLEVNILRLRSDLKLAAAELQAKNATIEAQRLTIDIQKGLLSGEIIFDSMKDVTPKTEDKEDVLGGIVALATYKDKGVEINLAELFRKLKGMFKDKE